MKSKTIILLLALTVIFISPTIVNADLPSSNLVLRCPMNSTNSNSTQTTCYGLAAANATVSGATYNSSDGGFYKFDGVNDVINTLLDGDYQNQNVTVSVWTKMSVGCTDGMDLVADRFDWRLFVSGSCVPKLNAKNSSGTDITTTQSNWGALSSTYWTHMCMYYDNQAQKRYDFLNGVQWGNSTQNGTSTTADNFTMGVGQAGTYFNGSIDDFVIYNNTGYSCQAIYLNGRNDVGTVNTTINFSTNSILVANDSFGWNLHQWQGINGSFVDANGDGSIDTLSNATWLQNLLNNASNARGYRMDSELDQLLSSITGYTIVWRNNGNSNARNMTHHQQMTNWTIAYNKTMIVGIQYMPSTIANTTNCAADTKTCLPSNYSQWCAIVSDYINTTGQNNSIANFEYEIWNEPDSAGFFMAGMDPTTNATNRSILYTDHLYIPTWTCLRNTYGSSIKIGGPTVASVSTAAGSALMSYFLNSSANYSFLTHHDYVNTVYDGGSYDSIFSTFNTLDALVVASGDTAPLRKLTEWNQNMDSVADNAVRDEMEGVSVMFAQLDYQLRKNLTGYPAPIYEFTCISNLTVSGCNDNHPTVSEPQLSNTIRGLYTAVKRLSDALPKNSSWYNITDSDEMTRVRFSSNVTNRFVVISNLHNISQNHTLYFVGVPNVVKLMDMENGTNYTVTNNLSTTLELTTWGVRYFEIINSSAPSIITISNTSLPSSIQINFTTSIASNASINYGTTSALGTTSTISSFLTTLQFNLSSLISNTTYYYNLTLCDANSLCATTGPYNISTQLDYTIQDKSGNRLNLSYIGSISNLFYNSTGYYLNGSANGFNNFNESQTYLRNFTHTSNFSLFIDFQMYDGACNGSFSTGLIGKYFRYGIHAVNSGCTLQYGLRNSSNSSAIVTSSVSVGTSRTSALFTYDGSTGNTSLYVNGTLRSSVIRDVTNIDETASSTPGIKIFDERAIVGGSNRKGNGTVFDAKIFNKTINFAEAVALHNNYSVGCNNLVGWYDFENSSTTACTLESTAPSIVSVINDSSITTAQINLTYSEIANISINYGTTTALGTVTNNITFFNNSSVSLSGLSAGTVYYFNLTVCDPVGNCGTYGNYNFSTKKNISVSISATSPFNIALEDEIYGLCNYTTNNGNSYYNYTWYLNGSQIESGFNGSYTYQEFADQEAAIAGGQYGSIFENYTIPPYSSAILQYKIGTGISNYSVPSSCLLSSTLQILTNHTNYDAIGPSAVIFFYCYNSSGSWEYIASNGSGSHSVGGDPYSDIYYSRATDGDYSTWASYQAASGWAYNNVNQFSVDVYYEQGIYWNATSFRTKVNTTLVNYTSSIVFSCSVTDDISSSSFFNSSQINMTDGANPNHGSTLLLPLTPVSRDVVKIYSYINDSDSGLFNVSVNITRGVYSVSYAMNDSGSGYYEYYFSDTEASGVYNIVTNSIDNYGNTNTSSTSFTIVGGSGSGGGGSGGVSIVSSPSSSGGYAIVRDSGISYVNTTFKPEIPRIDSFVFIGSINETPFKTYEIFTNRVLKSCSIDNYGYGTPQNSFECGFYNSTLLVSINLYEGIFPLSKTFEAEVTAYSVNDEAMKVPIRVTTFSLHTKDANDKTMVTKVLLMAAGGLVVLFGIAKLLNPSKVKL